MTVLRQSFLYEPELLQCQVMYLTSLQLDKRCLQECHTVGWQTTNSNSVRRYSPIRANLVTRVAGHAASVTVTGLTEHGVVGGELVESAKKCGGACVWISAKEKLPDTSTDFLLFMSGRVERRKGRG